MCSRICMQCSINVVVESCASAPILEIKDRQSQIESPTFTVNSSRSYMSEFREAVLITFILSGVCSL